MEQQIKANTKEIMIKLSRIQADMNFVKEHIDDITLSEDDLESIKEAEKDLKEGKTTPIEDLEKELDM